MAVVYIDDAVTVFTDEEGVSTVFTDESRWKSQQFEAPVSVVDDPLYYDDIDNGGIAAGVE